MMNALIVDGNRRNAGHLASGLRNNGFSVEVSTGGECACMRLASACFAAAVVDVCLPDMSGYELVRRLRERDCRVPVLLVGSTDRAVDRIRGLDAGADDFLSRPFSVEELAARLNAILRRALTTSAGGHLSVRDLTIDHFAGRAYRGGRPLVLTPKEYRLLEYMTLNAGHMVSSDMILQAVWGCRAPTQTTVVESMLCKLRRKLCENGEDDLIHTVRSFGYVLQ